MYHACCMHVVYIYSCEPALQQRERRAYIYVYNTHVRPRPPLYTYKSKSVDGIY